MNNIKLIGTMALICAVSTLSAGAVAKDRTTGRGNPDGPVVFVTSQGLYYDSIVLADLPQKGRFQQLVPDENGLTTEFGPGQPGHLGGRWWIDVTDDGEMNEGDLFFLCPLLGPGREEI